MGCGKKTYKDRALAKKFKKKYNKIFTTQAQNEYYCEECSGWHLTTMDKGKSRKLNRND